MSAYPPPPPNRRWRTWRVNDQMRHVEHWQRKPRVGGRGDKKYFHTDAETGGWMLRLHTFYTRHHMRLKATRRTDLQPPSTSMID